MQQRVFGRTGWVVGDVGYGMWGMGGWTGSDDDESRRSLERAVERGCTFFDTAWAYGMGHSERLLGELPRKHPERRLYAATKIPPKNAKWPARAEYPLDDVFPAEHIRRFTERSLENLGLPALDLIQFHVWSGRLGRGRAVAPCGRESQERWPGAGGRHQHQSLGAGERAPGARHRAHRRRSGGLQHLRPGAGGRPVPRLPGVERGRHRPGAVRRGNPDRHVDARQPLAGRRFPEHRTSRGRLGESVLRAEALRPLVPAGETMATLALRWILSNPAVSVVIPGMRKLAHVEANLGASDRGALPADVMAALAPHRWDRQPGLEAGLTRDNRSTVDR